jgi:hypothetical protein
MANIRNILANNLKENCRKCGVSQAKLAEKAGVSTQYIAMIEISRQFPTPEVLDRKPPPWASKPMNFLQCRLPPKIQWNGFTGILSRKSGK